ncbi:uncharacterized protein si:ch211-119e14.1 [Syngnathus typhle]|uniref:uncharacterized protein si:ch211-119e14.1 n=1 Tax=Syngnathus typhle TaxID=161592 RepID=UPI002A6B2429|nr:uncharacterized protein si:ch211-119e14.1 [Syngnathus typhle]
MYSICYSSTSSLLQMSSHFPLHLNITLHSKQVKSAALNIFFSYEPLVHDVGMATAIVVLLFFIFVILLLLLIVLYKKLNRETNGQYTLQRVVYGEGGLRDRARTMAAVLENRLGVQLWPHGSSDEDGEEMQDFQEEPRQKAEYCSGSSDGSQNGEDGKPQGWSVKARRESETHEESRGTDVFINLNQFSKSVMWSEQDD